MDAELLRQVKLFRGLTQEEMDSIADVASLWECRKGQYIFKEGDESEVLYIVQSGLIAAQISVGILVNHTVAKFGPGEIFGELAFIERHPRTATLKCVKNAELIAITRDDFRRLGARYPNLQRIIFKNIAKTLSERLRHANENLKELAGRDKNLAVYLPQHLVV